MRRLLLLRHAKSDWADPGARDHDRGLAVRGRETAPRLGAYMVRHALVPDLALVSTALRARATWELVAAAFPGDVPVTYEERIYPGSGEGLLGLAREAKKSVHVLLLVGHNPAMRDFAELLIASGDVEMRQRLLEKFPTAALAVIDFPIDDWTKLHPKAGRLDRFVIPRALETATD